jgi:hypothetical protein
MLGRRAGRFGVRRRASRRLTGCWRLRRATAFHRHRTLRHSRGRYPRRDPRKPSFRPYTRPTSGLRHGSTVRRGPRTPSRRRYGARLDVACSSRPLGARRGTANRRAASRRAVGVGRFSRVGGERIAKLTGYRCLHRRGGRFHILTKIGELLEYILTGDAELLCELVHTGLACHCSPH